MSARWWVVALVLALGVPVVGLAAGATCTQYKRSVTFGNGHSYNSGWQWSQNQACSALASAINGGGEYPGGFSLSYSSGNGRCSGTNSNGSWDDGSIGGWSTQSASCPVDPCADAKSTAEANGAGGIVEAGAKPSPSGNLCLSDDGTGGSYSGGTYGTGCAVSKAGSGIESSDSSHWFGQLKYTGTSCPASPTPEELSDKSNCVSTSAGTMCVAKGQKNCGTFNGEKVCLDTIPPGTCTLLGSGGAVCDSSAADQPTVEGGGPATPAGVMTGTNPTTGSQTTYNYYGPTQVVGSTTPTTGPSNPTRQDGGPDGLNPDPAEPESLDDLEGGEFTDDEDIGAGLSGFWSAVAGSPIVTAASAVAGSIGTATCPFVPEPVSAGAWSFVTMDFTPMCTLWDDIAPVIGAVMLAIYAFLGFRILMSA